MIIETLKNYTPDDAEQIRGLLKQLSRSGKDRGEIPKSWFNDLIASPYHDLLIAREEPTEKTAGIVPQNQDSDLENPSPDSSSKGGKIIGVACLSVLMGPIVRKNAFLEDFVTDESVRGQGVGTALWDAMLDWARAKGCQKLEFTCGLGRDASQAFYKNRGAKIYDTNYFRYDLTNN